jgi:response regulator of citrate/malate metabolism
MDSLTVEQLLGYGTAIVAAGGVIGYLIKPFAAYMKKTKQIDKEIEAIKEHQDNDNKRLEVLERDSKMNLKVQNAILGHLQTGNNTGNMSKVKKELENYIIER